MKATKTEVINCLYEQSQLNKAQSKQTLNLILENIQSLLERYGTVELRGFGTFSTHIRKARDNARNPRTGERVSVEARRAPYFKPGKKMRKAVALRPGDSG